MARVKVKSRASTHSFSYNIIHIKKKFFLTHWHQKRMLCKGQTALSLIKKKKSGCPSEDRISALQHKNTALKQQQDNRRESVGKGQGQIHWWLYSESGWSGHLFALPKHIHVTEKWNMIFFLSLTKATSSFGVAAFKSQISKSAETNWFKKKRSVKEEGFKASL